MKNTFLHPLFYAASRLLSTNMIKMTAAFVCLMIPFVVSGQGSGDYSNTTLQMPNYVPQPPEVSAFKLYGDIPVSEYTGTPDISIPLYTLRQGSIEVPVTLSYHPGGVKVAQEASWVGLGWDIVVGGVVSVEPVGIRDATCYTGGYDTESWNGFNRMVQEWLTGNGHYTPSDSRSAPEDIHMWLCDEYSTTPLETVVEGLQGAGERDVYRVSLPGGKSFSFILHPKDNTPVIVGKSANVKISFSSDAITIIDENGTRYAFEEVDVQSTPLNYRLTSIRSKEGDVVSFTYTLVSEISISGITESYTFDRPPIESFLPTRSLMEIPPISVHYLSSIETDTEKLDFTLLSRSDKYPGSSGRLSSLKLVSKLNSKEIFRYDFNQTYFAGTNIGGDYLNDKSNGNVSSVIPESVRQKRLKLLGITKRVGTSGPAETYTFTYNEITSLPYKTSFACDYWGYYNGAENASTLIPGYKHTLIPDINVQYNNSLGFSATRILPSAGAIRNSSATHITTGMLKSIEYPTKGRVEFEFEPHTFNNYKIISKENVDSYNRSRQNITTIDNNNAEFSIHSVNFTIPYTQEVTFNATVNFAGYSIAQVSGSGSMIRKVGPGGSLIKDFRIIPTDTITNSFNMSETLTLEPGDYVMASSLSDLIPDQHYSAGVSSHAYLTYYSANPGNFDSSESIGGGVRIKRIAHKDHDGNTLKITDYKYENISGKSSGNLLFPLMMVKNDYVVNSVRDNATGRWKDTYYNYCMVTSSSLGVHPACDGTPIGYSRVTVETIGTANAGRTILEFANSPTTLSSEGALYISSVGKFIPAPNNNGSLLKRQVYGSANALLMEENNSYEVTGITKNILNIHTADYDYGKGIDCVNVPSSQREAFFEDWSPRFLITLYPSISYWVDHKQHTETTYFNEIPVTRTESYTYDSYHRPSKITRSSGRSALPFVEEFTYAFNNDLISYNVLSLVQTHTRHSGNSYVTLSNSYGNWQQKFCKLSTIQGVSYSPFTTTVTYKYDPKWNPVEVTFQNTLSDVYLWGYNYSRVIAHIKNTTYAEVQSRMGSSLQTLCSANEPSPTMLEGLRTAFPECEVTTWLYEPSVGMKQQTFPWEVPNYFEWDVFGRLHRITEPQSTGSNTRRVVKEFNYNYKNQ